MEMRKLHEICNGKLTQLILSTENTVVTEEDIRPRDRKKKENYSHHLKKGQSFQFYTTNSRHSMYVFIKHRKLKLGIRKIMIKEVEETKFLLQAKSDL